jgi:xanthine dehydrogenase YagS FAD-binding subunit
MRPFKYTRATTLSSAGKELNGNAQSRLLAGGTNLLDLMKEDVERPEELIDITHLPHNPVKPLSQGAAKPGVLLDALGKNSETANHPLIRSQYPLLSQAILAGASAQIRNMATNGGNLLQRTRCPYFYDVAMPCNKRTPGSGCGAMEGFNRMHAVFGWSDKCIAVHPSDMAVALAALDAQVLVQNPSGQQKRLTFDEFFRLPGDAPEKDNNLQHGDLITGIELPANNFADHSYYAKVRDRSSYAFALISVAAGLQLSGNQISDVRIAMGGVAHRPWRALTAEKMLKGKAATEANFKAAAEAEMAAAKPHEYNKFKVKLGKRAIALALNKALNNGSK